MGACPPRRQLDILNPVIALGSNVHIFARPHRRDAPDDDHPRLGAWLELRADDPAAVHQAALDAGLTEVKHPGHPYYFMVPGGQVFTIAPSS
jgi:hypothetical protein